MSIQLLPSARIKGRLETLVRLILNRKGVSNDIICNKTLFDNYFDALYYATEQEALIIRSLMDKYNERKQNERYYVDSSGQQQIGADETIYIYEKNKDISTLLLDKDIIKRKKPRKQWPVLNFVYVNRIKIGLIACVTIVLSVLTYNLPYFLDKFFFIRVQEVRTLSICNEYIKKYPKGRYLDDVLYIKVNLDKDINYVMDYLNKFPRGKYADVVNSVCDSLWNEEIRKYQNYDKKEFSQDAVKYMTHMLAYMKVKRINTIYLNIESEINLKEYDEYDESTREICEFLNSFDNSSSEMILYKDKLGMISRSSKDLPIAQNILSLKSNFKSANIQTLTGIISDGLEESFNKMFTRGFLRVGEYSSYKNQPKISIHYNIRNEVIENIPIVWLYSKNHIVEKYLLGIAVDFKVECSIPNSAFQNVQYSYEETGNPGNSINNILNIEDGYKQMTQICFAQFSNTMADQLGLEQVYFQGDE